MITTSGPYSKDIIKTTEPSAMKVHLMNDYYHWAFRNYSNPYERFLPLNI